METSRYRTATIRSGALSLSVLGLEEEGQWCAIALEMSLRGYGLTFESALDELRDAIKAQVTFTIEHGNADQLFFPAEPKYIERYVRTRCFEALAAVFSNLAPDATDRMFPVPTYVAPPVRRFRMTRKAAGFEVAAP